MAIPYTICVNDASQTTQVTMTTPSTYSTRSYTIGSCEVLEQTKRLHFTCTVASDTSFGIQYTYTINYEENYVDMGTDDRFATVTMPAGATSVYVDVLWYKRTICSDGTYPKDRDGGIYPEQR